MLYIKEANLKEKKYGMFLGKTVNKVSKKVLLLTDKKICYDNVYLKLNITSAMAIDCWVRIVLNVWFFKKKH